MPFRCAARYRLRECCPSTQVQLKVLVKYCVSCTTNSRELGIVRRIPNGPGPSLAHRGMRPDLNITTVRYFLHWPIAPSAGPSPTRWRSVTGRRSGDASGDAASQRADAALVDNGGRQEV
jgi:hypothetical protein